LEELDLGPLELELGACSSLLEEEDGGISPLEEDGGTPSLEEEISSSLDEEAGFSSGKEEDEGNTSMPELLYLSREEDDCSFSSQRTSNRFSLPSLHPMASMAKTRAAIKERDTIYFQYCRLHPDQDQQGV
jgi:hypothetical protein